VVLSRFDYNSNPHPSGFGLGEEGNAICKGFHFVDVPGKVRDDVPYQSCFGQWTSIQHALSTPVAHHPGIDRFCGETSRNGYGYAVNLIARALIIVSQVKSYPVAKELELGTDFPGPCAGRNKIAVSHHIRAESPV